MREKPAVMATIGMFDGVHRGHRFVIDNLVSRAHAEGMTPMVVTFSNHPLSVVRPEAAPKILTGPAKKADLLHALGVEDVVVEEFTPELRKLTAEQFLTMLRDKYGVGRLLIGYDHTFGSDSPRTPEAFRQLGERLGIEVEILPQLPHYGERICSTTIRNLIGAGRVEDAAAMLGHPFAVEGTVVEGHQLGRTIGFPTANVDIDSSLMIPGGGVYAAVATLADGSRHRSMVNIGRRPTVDNPDAPLTIEAHLIGFKGNLYGQLLTLDFVGRLRDERRFGSVEELQSALAADTAAALEVLSKVP